MFNSRREGKEQRKGKKEEEEGRGEEKEKFLLGSRFIIFISKVDDSNISFLFSNR